MRISDWSSDVCSSDLSWRVSTMGLMNVGQTEGSQIIQLFGRGVRLKGYGSSLKRSGKTELPDDMTRPKDIGVLETLSIFGLRADYMAQFRDFLEEEGLPTNDDRDVFLRSEEHTYELQSLMRTSNAAFC